MPTDNFTLHTPAYGDYYDEWHQPANENFEWIDEALPVLDLTVNIDNYTPHQDTAFISTDDHDLYFGDGTEWQLQGTLMDVQQDDLDAVESDLQTQIDSKADDPHGNEAHSSTFAIDGDAQPPETHDNTAHSEDYLTEASVADKADDPHGNAAHTETFATEGQLFSGSYSDLTDVPSTFAPETHDNTAHSTNYASETYVDSNAAADPHGNEAHSSTFAVDGDAQPPESHGNEAHSSTFATEGQLFSGSYVDLTDVPNEFTPEAHDNTAHSTNYLPESDAYTDSEARTAVNNSDVDITGSAQFWDNYELVFDDETPSTNQYIRITHES